MDPRTWTACKLYFFLFHFGRHYSSILLVVMSLEKCFAVYFPLKSKSICTVKTAKWVTGIFGVILAGYNSVYFFLRKTQIDKKSGYMKCVFVSHSETLNMIESYSLFIFSFMFNVHN